MVLTSEIFSGAGKKRKLTDNSNSVSKRQQCGSLSSCNSYLNSIDCAGSGTGKAIAKSEEGLSGELQRSSSQTAAKLKMSRPFNWIRNKKHTLLSIPECRDETIFRIICSDEYCLPGSLMCPSNTNQVIFFSSLF